MWKAPIVVSGTMRLIFLTKKKEAAAGAAADSGPIKEEEELELFCHVPRWILTSQLPGNLDCSKHIIVGLAIMTRGIMEPLASKQASHTMLFLANSGQKSDEIASHAARK